MRPLEFAMHNDGESPSYRYGDWRGTILNLTTLVSVNREKKIGHSFAQLMDGVAYKKT
jgi:hypothetical protein